METSRNNFFTARRIRDPDALAAASDLSIAKFSKPTIPALADLLLEGGFAQTYGADTSGKSNVDEDRRPFASTSFYGINRVDKVRVLKPNHNNPK